MKTRALVTLLVLALAAPLWAAAPARADIWHLETARDLASYSWGTSLKLDGAGYPHIAFYDIDVDQLQYVYKDAAGWHLESIAAAGWAGGYPSLALDAAGSPCIAYFDHANGDIRYATRDPCSHAWSTELVADAGSYGGEVSLALDSGGTPHISFNAEISAYHVRYATKSGGTWTNELIKVVSGFGGHTSLALGSDGQPHVAFTDDRNVRYAYRDAGGWHDEVAATTGWFSGWPSLALDSTGYPHISFYDDVGSALRYAYKAAAGWSAETLLDAGFDGAYTSLALDGMDRPHIAFLDGNGYSVRYAEHDGAAWQVETLAAVGDSGGYCSLVLDGADQPHVSLLDSVATAIKYTYRSAGPPPITRYADLAGACAGRSPCYATIGGAVAAANSGDTIHVFPGTYAESVNLGGMALPGNLTLATVDAAGSPAPGTATVSPASGPAFYTTPALPGRLSLDGFTAGSANAGAISITANSHVVIENVTVGGAADDGVFVDSLGGNVTVRDSVASGNQGAGLADGFDLGAPAGSVTVANCTANDNTDEGFDVDAAGLVSIDGCTALGNGDDGLDIETGGDVVVARCTANGTLDDYDGDGVDVLAGGSVSVSQVTAIGNAQEGIDVEDGGAVTVRDCHVEDNGDTGVDLDNPGGGSTVQGGIICGNAYGLDLGAAVTLNAEATWWGCAAGPGGAGCDTANPGPGTIDFEPWIDTTTVTATVDPVNAGEPSVIRFRFSGGGETVFLGPGPGDPRGTPPFRVTTDNGTLTDSDETGRTVFEFVNQPDGVLEVTLIPIFGGTTTVTLDGPCGLDGSISVEAIGPDRHSIYLPLVMRGSTG